MSHTGDVRDLRPCFRGIGVGNFVIFVVGIGRLSIRFVASSSRGIGGVSLGPSGTGSDWVAGGGGESGRIRWLVGASCWMASAPTLLLLLLLAAALLLASAVSTGVVVTSRHRVLVLVGVEVLFVAARSVREL